MGRHRRRSLMQFRAAVAQRDHQRPVNQLQHVRPGSIRVVVPMPQVVVHELLPWPVSVGAPARVAGWSDGARWVVEEVHKADRRLTR